MSEITGMAPVTDPQLEEEGRGRHSCNGTLRYRGAPGLSPLHRGEYHQIARPWKPFFTMHAVDASLSASPAFQGP